MTIYAVSDIHGQYQQWQQLKEYLKEEDICYIIGDVIDRGKDGWKILKEVFNDKRFIFLKGNHEEMLINKNIYDTHTYNKMLQDENYIYYINKIIHSPSELIIFNDKNQKIIMCHAGYNYQEEDKGDILWNRKHINQKWIVPEDTYMIHGHTPNTNGKIKKYNNNIYNIDCGCFFTNILGLLNLDTFEELYFDGKDTY